MALGDVIEGSVAALGDRTAFVIDGASVSYREVGDAVAAAAANLRAASVSAGDRVALADRCGLFAIAGVLGAAKIGAAAAPMSPALTSGEIAALVTSAGCAPVGLSGDEAREAMTKALGREPLGEKELLARASSSAEHAVGGDDVCLVLFTGGTTGLPKPIPIKHATLETRVRGFAPPPDPNAPPVVTLVCVPFHHVAGLVGILVGLAGGATMVVQRRFDAGEWLRLVVEHRVERTFLVPTMLHRILDHPSFYEADTSSLQMITYGAAPAPPELIERAVRAFPHVGFINVFGQTETLGAVTALGPDEHRAGRVASVGMPLPGVEIRIVDQDSGAEGAEGELWVRAPHAVEEGWVRTGDLVRRDQDGRLSATGRLSDLINRGGEKIAPQEVERVLREHPSVVDAAVAGYGDPEFGERVGAALVVTGSVEAGVLKAWCRERLAAFKAPERFRFVREIPLTDLGKVSRPAIRALLEDGR